MKKTKIGIYINDCSKLGGVERVTSNLISLLQQKYNVTALLSLHKSSNLVIQYPPIKLYVLNSLNAIEIDRIIKVEHLTHLIVQIQYLSESYWVCSIAMQSGCKVIPILHSSPYCYIKKYGSWLSQISSLRSVLQNIKMQLYWRPKHLHLFRLFLQNVGLIVCVSKKAMEELKDILHLPDYDNRVDYIYNPISFLLTEYKGEKWNRLLYAGRLSFEKQPLKMLAIWKEIAKQCPLWEFYILGDGPYRKRMERFVSKNKLSNVTFLGVVRNVDEYMKKSKITLLCSYYEGLPTVLLEASVYENALVAINGDGGISDIVLDEINGCLVEDDDDSCLVNKLLYLMRNEGVCAEMGKNARKHIRTFNNENILEKWNTYLTD